ncbi:hypothetical protein QB910_000116 [Dabrowskivirus KKP3916]|uniref:Uncharacterized protein n=1 Tax=Alicyclobacillus phage KKP_3916 TaxID=3040651 RepID=A0AAT9V7U6_9CAUD|nr:hypothetical protein QB910_000116 [Alicyclobacillus phage KKP 3916]
MSQMHDEFQLGRVVATKSVAEQENQNELHIVLVRHASMDWGDIDQEDKDLNDKAIEIGERVVSKYKLSSGRSVYVITERDRSYTTILYPHEY